MAELFSRTEVDWGGAFHAQNGIITPKNGLTGVLMQNFSIQYQQQVTRLYELGKAGGRTKVYYVGGRANGSLSAAHVIGPGVSMKDFYNNFSDVCNAQNNECNLELGPNICGVVGTAGSTIAGPPAPGTTGAKYKCKYCVLVGIGLSVSASDFIINESSQLMFSGLEFDSN